MSERRLKKRYAANSFFVRAALDFADSYRCYQKFGHEFDEIPAFHRFEALRLAAGRMFELGHVATAYLHVNNQRDNGGLYHDFVITFSPVPSQFPNVTQIPSMCVPIKSEEELREKAAFYKEQGSIGLGIRTLKVKKKLSKVELDPSKSDSL